MYNQTSSSDGVFLYPIYINMNNYIISLIIVILIFISCHTINNIQSYPLKDKYNKLHRYKEDITLYHIGRRDMPRYCQVHYEWEYISIVNTLKNVDWMSEKHIKKEFIVRDKPAPA